MVSLDQASPSLPPTPRIHHQPTPALPSLPTFTYLIPTSTTHYLHIINIIKLNDFCLISFGASSISHELMKEM